MKALFLDKDGTLIRDIPYNVDPERITLCEGVADGLRLCAELGYMLIVVSNQPGIAKGYFNESALDNAHRKLIELLNAENIELHAFYYCPHHQDGNVARYSIRCQCRKPAPGLLLQAARDHGIALSDSWMVGDILNDIEAGNRAGCRTILIGNGNETEWDITAARIPDHIVSDVYAAAKIIARADLAHTARRHLIHQ
jgi:D-glycero-D-manno-heptose 1,7-bisphosphate phosphatase